MGTFARWATAALPGLFAAGDRRAGMRGFTGNGPGKATFTGRRP